MRQESVDFYRFAAGRLFSIRSSRRGLLRGAAVRTLGLAAAAAVGCEEQPAGEKSVAQTISYMKNTGDPEIMSRAAILSELKRVGFILYMDKVSSRDKQPTVVLQMSPDRTHSLRIGVQKEWGKDSSLGDADRTFYLVFALSLYGLAKDLDWRVFADETNRQKYEDMAIRGVSQVVFPVLGSQMKTDYLVSAAAQFNSRPKSEERAR